METEQNTHEIHVERPQHPVPRRYHEPIFYLATEMYAVDKILPVPESRGLDDIADTLSITDYRNKRWFRDLDDDLACSKIDSEVAKRGALVVLSYVLKRDTNGTEKARNFFSRIRRLLETEPVAMPADLDEHWRLVKEYLSN